MNRDSRGRFGLNIRELASDSAEFTSLTYSMIVNWGPMGRNTSFVGNGYVCQAVPPCRQWPGGCCGTYGSCQLDPSRQHTMYIGCFNSDSECEQMRFRIKEYPATEKNCGNNEGLYKKG